MTDWAEFYDDEDFAAYRREQVAVVARHVYGLVNHISHRPEDARELKGALDMAHKIMSLPQLSTRDEKLQLKYAEMLKEDMAGIAAGLVQRRFEG